MKQMTRFSFEQAKKKIEFLNVEKLKKNKTKRIFERGENEQNKEKIEW